MVTRHCSISVGNCYQLHTWLLILSHSKSNIARFSVLDSLFARSDKMKVLVLVVLTTLLIGVTKAASYKVNQKKVLETLLLNRLSNEALKQDEQETAMAQNHQASKALLDLMKMLNLVDKSATLQSYCACFRSPCPCDNGPFPWGRWTMYKRLRCLCCSNYIICSCIAWLTFCALKYIHCIIRIIICFISRNVIW